MLLIFCDEILQSIISGSERSKYDLPLFELFKILKSGTPLLCSIFVCQVIWLYRESFGFKISWDMFIALVFLKGENFIKNSYKERFYTL